MAVYDLSYRFPLILWGELCKGGAQSPGAVCTVGACASYDGPAFRGFSVVRDGWYHDVNHIGTASDPPSVVN